MKKVLMICFYFPPIGGAGTQRSSKFVKYLPRCGWMPTVIGGIDDTWPQDRTLLADIPEGVQVHRLPQPVSVWRRMREWMLSHWIGPIGWGQFGNRLGWFLDFPDTRREWADTSAEMALHLCQHEKFEAVYTTLPPHSAATAIRRVQKELGLPWVVDFRDPWARNDVVFGGLPSWVRRRHDRAERETVLHVDALVCAHPSMVKYFVETYGIPEERCRVIYNGFDADDYPGVTTLSSRPVHQPRQFVIVHTGTFYGNYNADALALALRDGWTGPPDEVDHVEFRFVGGAANTRFEARPGLKVTITPRVPHDAALKEQANADVLLAVFDRRMYGGHIPGKLFEYLASGRPILGILPSDGAMAGIIRNCRAGWVVDCDASQQIVRTIREIVVEVTRPGFRFEPDRAKINRFSRATLTQELATVLEQAATV